MELSCLLKGMINLDYLFAREGGVRDVEVFCTRRATLGFSRDTLRRSRL